MSGANGKKGAVALVGAGCGTFDLITLRGKACLQNCDVVVYDSLIDLRLLDFAPETAERICVGKRAGRHSETQERICEILVEQARLGKKVVRLKGGDPFVFGRGGEEILALQQAQIPYTLVPGISSSIAVPELAGIPVTHRKTSRSFHVITGHTADSIVTDKLIDYARLDGTLVFLMGLKNLQQITDGLILGGKVSTTPATIISHGATPQQKRITGTLGTIAEEATRQGMETPAILVVGETVRMDLSPTLHLPLEQIRITVTGTKQLTDKLMPQLTALGAEVQRLDSLHVTPYTETEQVDRALTDIGQYSWLVLTSMNGVDLLWQHLRRRKQDIRSLGHIRFAVIGAGTAQRLMEHGVIPALIPEQYTAEALGTALTKCVLPEEKVLLLRAEKGSPRLTEMLAEQHIAYADIKTYDVTGTAVTDETAVIDTDYICFASASGVDAFFQSGRQVSDHTKIVCIGGVTAKALERHGSFSALISEVQTVDGMIATIVEGERR